MKGASRSACAAMLVALVFFAFHRSLAAPFIFDDKLSIAMNPKIGVLWPLSVAMDRPPKSDLVARPVVTLSLSLNYRLGGWEPLGYHIFNTSVHALSALALYALLLEIFPRTQIPLSDAAAQQAAAWVIAAAWAIHPLQTQAVIYTVQRGELLAGLCQFLILYALMRSNTAAHPARWWFVGTIASLVGMGSKPVLVTAALIALLFDRLLLSDSWRSLWRKRAWFYGGLSLGWLVLWALVAASPPAPESSAGFDVKDLTWVKYVSSQPAVVLHYLRLVFWPHPLCFDYKWPPPQAWPRDVWLALAALGAAMAAALAVSADKRLVRLMVGWFVLALAPTSFLIPIKDLAVEHRMYVALAPVLVIIAATAARPLAALFSKKLPRLLGMGLLALFLATLTLATWSRSLVYATEDSVWIDVLQTHPRNFRALGNLATLLLEEKQVGKIMPYLEKAIELDPGNGRLYDMLGFVLMAQEKWKASEQAYARAISLEPGKPHPHTGMAALLIKERRLEEALRQQGIVVRLDAANPQAYYDLGRILLMLNDRDSARRFFKAALERNSRYAPARWALEKMQPVRGEAPVDRL